MQTQLNTKDLKRPFPALTPAQRWHVEVFGYVVVENVFDDNEVGLMLEALQKLKRDCYDREDPWSSEPVHNCTMYHSGGHLGVPMTFTFNGLYHCHFVKAITNLTELGPDDGGTCVIAGTHKVTCREEGIAEAARQDPSMIHQVVAPAGSTLLFCQTLLHATGDIRSDRERSIIITGDQTDICCRRRMRVRPLIPGRFRSIRIRSGCSSMSFNTCSASSAVRTCVVSQGAKDCSRSPAKPPAKSK